MYHLFKHQLENLVELHTRKGREKQGYFLIEGEKVVRDALRAGWKLQGLVLTDEALKKSGSLLKECADIQPLLATSEQMNKLSETMTPTGLVAVVRLPGTSPLPAEGIVLALDDIADPGNLGTIIRTADWFGIKHMLLSPGTVDPFNGKVVRAAMGSLFNMQFCIAADFETDVRSLQASGYRVVVTTASGKDAALTVSDKLCLVLGSEAHGVSQGIERIADSTYTISGTGNAESLNVAVSAGIVLYSLMGANL
jgi:TrmH family RNA methyltransferase